MKLCDAGLRDPAWKEKGYELPAFDRAAMVAKTKEAPVWLHFGAGNIFRGFPAMLQQKLLDTGAADRGIVVCEGYDYEIIEKIYAPHDNLSVLVVLGHDGRMEKRVVASVAEALTTSDADWPRLIEVFTDPGLQMVSFTITEKGYAVQDAGGSFFPAVQADFAAGPAAPQTIIGRLCGLLYARYQKNAAPLAMVSMDNCSHNGDKLRAGILAFAERWVAGGKAEEGFLPYLTGGKVSFPWSMIDKITPRPDETVRATLSADGLEDTTVITTAKHTYIAPFVNAEGPQYLVIEDAFPNGRPALEQAGVIFTSRETVDQVEKMKVCTCLNPLHTALAVYGCLLGYQSISAEMGDPQLRALVEKVGYQEGLPVVVDPKIVSPADFIREVIEVRLPNPFVPDTPQRIATDTSQKLSIRYGETIKAYGEKARELVFLPLVQAGWCRYMLGLDDAGEAFAISPDPMAQEVQAALCGITLGWQGDLHQKLLPLLSNTALFGVDLYAVGLGEKVEGYFAELIAGPGAVRATLTKYLG